MNERIPKPIQNALTKEYKLWGLSEINPNHVPERQTGVTWHVLVGTAGAYILGDVSRISPSSLLVEHIKFQRQSELRDETCTEMPNPSVLEIEIEDIANIYQVEGYYTIIDNHPRKP
ncbi:MAG TPA: hypothetical protein VJK72_03920 [Candidatus Nanoarchaeia archaeon]|nr:hypothetical protein [Candidatus Nanoarchaeia archaeon]